MNATLFVILVGVIVLGLVLFLLGKRGRKLNNHPQCRDCGFDLEGVFPASITCPECGSGLRRPKAVRNGVRRRMAWMMALGVLIALLPLAPLFTVMYAAATGTNLARYTPTGLLLWQSRISSAAVQKQIASELVDRMIRKELDKGQSVAVGERALEIQADGTHPWDECWGEVIERIQLNGDLSADQQKRFRKQALHLSARCRPSVRAGDPLPVVIKLDSARVAPSSQLLAVANVDTAKMGAETLAKPKATRQNAYYNNGGMVYFYLYGSKAGNGWMGTSGQQQEQVTAVTIPRDTPPGSKTITVTLLSKVNDQQSGWSGSLLKSSDKNATPHVFTLQVNVLPPDADPVTRKEPTAEQEKAMRDLLRQTNVTAAVNASTSVLPFVGGLSVTRMVSLQLQYDDPPMPFAFDVYIKLGEKETKLGEFSSGTSTQNPYNAYYSGLVNGSKRNLWLSAEVPSLKKSDKTADLIFRPSAKAAMNTLELSEIYGKEVVLKNVRLTVQEQRYNTTTTTVEPETEPEPPADP